MKQIQQFTNYASRYLNVLACISLLGIMLLVTFNAISRRTFIGPVLGTYEFSNYMMGIVVAFTIALNQVRKANIEVEIVVTHLSRRVKAIVSSFVYIASVGLFVLATWSLVSYAFSLIESGETSYTLNIPFYPWVFAVSLCFALLVLVLMKDLIESVKEVFRNE